MCMWGDTATPLGLADKSYTSNVYAAKLDSGGNLTWNTFLGGGAYDYGYGIAVDGSGNVYVGGTSNATWGSPIRAYTSSADAFAAKIYDTSSKDNLLGTWDGQGVYFRDSDTGTWANLATPADLIACGDLYGDGVDDLIGIWSGQAGVWSRNSLNGNWAYLGSSPRHLATGDMNGDGRADLLGTWDGQGVFFRDSMAGTWNQMATPATLITAGDLDGDNKSDLIGIWPSQAGVWAKFSQSDTWSYIGSSLRDMATGDMNGDGRTDLVGTWDGQGVFYRRLDLRELDHDGHPGGPGRGGGFGRRRHGRPDRDLGRAGRRVGEVFGDGELGLYRKLGAGHSNRQDERRALGIRVEPANASGKPDGRLCRRTFAV